MPAVGMAMVEPMLRAKMVRMEMSCMVEVERLFGTVWIVVCKDVD